MAISRIFVSNLPWTVNAAKLRSYFSKFGDLELSTVVFDKNTGFSRGFGFISYTNQIGFEAALNTKRHIIDGQVVKVFESAKKE